MTKNPIPHLNHNTNTFPNTYPNHNLNPNLNPKSDWLAHQRISGEGQSHASITQKREQK